MRRRLQPALALALVVMGLLLPALLLLVVVLLLVAVVVPQWLLAPCRVRPPKVSALLTCRAVRFRHCVSFMRAAPFLSPRAADFVGWSGLGPVAVLFEYVFGIRADVPRGELRLDVRLLDAYGVSSFPFGADGLVCIDVGSRGSAAEEPVVTVVSTVALTVVLTWGGTMTEAGGAATRRTSTRAPFTRQFDVTPSTLPAAPAATGTAASAASA